MAAFRNRATAFSGFGRTPCPRAIKTPKRCSLCACSFSVAFLSHLTASRLFCAAGVPAVRTLASSYWACALPEAALRASESMSASLFSGVSTFPFNKSKTESAFFGALSSVNRKSTSLRMKTLRRPVDPAFEDRPRIPRQSVLEALPGCRHTGSKTVWFYKGL